MTSEDEKVAEVMDHHLEIGTLCTTWAYLEFLFEAGLWWLIGLHNRKTEGRVITSGLSLETLARKVSDLSHLKIVDASDRELLKSLRDRISAIVEERNLAVHGVRAADTEGNTFTAEVTRGTYKSKPQNLSLIRLKSLNIEVISILTATEKIFVRYQVIESMTDLSTHLQFLQQENKAR